MAPSRPERVFLFSTPRTCSNLLMKMLKGSSNTTIMEYEMMFPSTLSEVGRRLEDKPIEQFSPSEQQEIFQTFQKAFTAWYLKVEKSEKEEGRPILNKEHAFVSSDFSIVTEVVWGNHPVPNPDSIRSLQGPWTFLLPGETEPRPRTSSTMIPDVVLDSWTPFFLIRNPLRSVPSGIRVFIQKMGLSVNSLFTRQGSNFQLPRMVYDWYVDRGHLPPSNGEISWPIVIDADDLLSDKRIIEKVCKAIGIDPSEVKHEWPEMTEEQISQTPHLYQIMCKTIQHSGGVRSDLTATGMTLEGEKEKWKTEFGEEMADEIAALVEKAMPDYLHLWSKRVTV